MFIVAKVKIDQKQRPYWSMMLMHNQEVMFEVTSSTFNPVSKEEYWERFENAFVRMRKEIEKQKDQVYLMNLLIQEDVIPLNKPKD